MELVQLLDCLCPDPESKWWSTRDRNSLSALNPTGTVLSVLLPLDHIFHVLQELRECDNAVAPLH